jgi:hypothetical protein
MCRRIEKEQSQAESIFWFDCSLRLGSTLLALSISFADIS